MKIVLIVDEASLLRLEVFAEIHTITVFEQDSKSWLPIVLTGRSNLIDKLMYQTSAPLASRIVARSHMEPVNRQGNRSPRNSDQGGSRQSIAVCYDGLEKKLEGVPSLKDAGSLGSEQSHSK